MADPLSTIANVVAIAGATIASAKVICELVDDIRAGPDDLRSISRDIDSLSAAISPLHANLESIEAQHAIRDDPALIDAIGNLRRPLEDCKSTLEDIGKKIKKLSKLSSRPKSIYLGFTELKWAFISKKQIRNLQILLESRKSTLNVSLEAVNFLFLLRTVFSIPNGTPMSRATIASSQLLAASMLGHHPETLAINSAAHVQQCAMVDNTTACPSVADPTIVLDYFADSLMAFVRGTQRIFMLDDLSLAEHIIHVYHALGETLSSTPQGRRKIEELASLHAHKMAGGSQSHSTLHVFFNCISRCANQDSSTSTANLRRSFQGAPEYRFELGSSFNPQGYIVEYPVLKPLLPITILPSRENRRTMHYFLLYQSNRKWHRVIVSATFEAGMKDWGIFQAGATYGSRLPTIAFPAPVYALLETILLHMRLFEPVTQLSLDVTQQLSKSLVASKINSSPHFLETELSDASHLLRELQNDACQKFDESEVFVDRYVRRLLFHAHVGSKTYLLQKAAFATTGSQGKTGFRDFVEQIRKFIALRTCVGVARLVGITLDGSRNLLKGFLLEKPAEAAIPRIIGSANSLRLKIPWPIRRNWAIQMVQIFHDIHQLNMILGAVRLAHFGLRADGTVVLWDFQGSQKFLPNTQGFLPPEMRPSRENASISPADYTLQTDIFQLGLMLWLIAEHQPLGGPSVFCPRNVCTQFPRIACTAAHANPVELPWCAYETPDYYSDAVEACRFRNPTARSSSENILHLLQRGKLQETQPVHQEYTLGEIMPLIHGEEYFSTWCNECGELIAGVGYHCNICDDSDFDLCVDCVVKGVHCHDGEHRLMKRLWKNGTLVDIGSKSNPDCQSSQLR